MVTLHKMTMLCKTVTFNKIHIEDLKFIDKFIFIAQIMVTLHKMTMLCKLQCFNDEIFPRNNWRIGPEERLHFQNWWKNDMFLPFLKFKERLSDTCALCNCDKNIVSSLSHSLTNCDNLWQIWQIVTRTLSAVFHILWQILATKEQLKFQMGSSNLIR